MLYFGLSVMHLIPAHLEDLNIKSCRKLDRTQTTLYIWKLKNSLHTLLTKWCAGLRVILINIWLYIVFFNNSFSYLMYIYLFHNLVTDCMALYICYSMLYAWFSHYSPSFTNTTCTIIYTLIPHVCSPLAGIFSLYNCSHLQVVSPRNSFFTIMQYPPYLSFSSWFCFPIF